MEVTKARYKINTRLKKRSRIKLIALITGIFLVLTVGGGYSFAALTKVPPALIAATAAPAPRQPEVITIPWLGQGQAAIGTLEDGVLATSTESEQPKPIASMTKVITALAVLDKAPKAQNYTISETDVNFYKTYIAKGGSVVPVKVGQTLSRTEVFEALLIGSANNLADSLVNWHFTSMQDFTDYTNKMLKAYGLTHTTIADASGFSPQTQSIPSDLLVIAQKALAIPEIASIVSMKDATISNSGVIRNTNRLLAEPGVIGIKTGTTDEAGNCLLFAASHKLASGKTVTLLGVVMGAPNSTTVFNNSKALLGVAAANYQNVEVTPAGTEVGTITSAWGQTTKLITAKSLSTDTWKGKLLSPELVMSEIGNVVSDDQKVGQVHLENNTEVDVVAEQTIGLPGNLWRLSHLF